MTRIIPTILLLLIAETSLGQQYALYNSRTLFDAFENPSQKAFIADTSRKYAFNIFIPTFAANTSFIGPAQTQFKDLAFSGKINGTVPPAGNNRNTLITNSNTYLVMFKIFKSVEFNKELGFSWQIKHDARITATTETFALLSNINRFNNNEYANIFNNHGTQQTYHQFSATYREDYNKRLGLGVKLSLLSGIAYNRLRTNTSSFHYNTESDQLDLGFEGKYTSSFDLDKLDNKAVLPVFKNPGLSLSASANYKFPFGWYLLGTLKDLGFIKWHKTSRIYPFNGDLHVQNASSNGFGKRVADQFKDLVNSSVSQGSFTTLTNAKMELLLNKDLDRYQPTMVLSKNLFYPGGDVMVIHNYLLNSFVLSASTGYSFSNFAQVGGQVLFKTANFEIFGGTDQLFQTYYTAKNIADGSSSYGNGYTGASVYFGMSLKFGPSMEHPLNSSTIPGIDNTKHVRSGFFKRFISKIGQRGKKKEK